MNYRRCAERLSFNARCVLIAHTIGPFCSSRTDRHIPQAVNYLRNMGLIRFTNAAHHTVLTESGRLVLRELLTVYIEQCSESRYVAEHEPAETASDNIVQFAAVACG